MGGTTASLTVELTAQEANEPFDLVTDSPDQDGNSPMTVKTGNPQVTITEKYMYGSPNPFAVSRIIKRDDFAVLDGVSQGVQRIRVYCSDSVASTVRVLTDEGSVKWIGRRVEPITETLTWSGETGKRVRYGYGQPDCAVRDQTRFRTLSGDIVDPPKFQHHLGGYFYSPVPVFGAMVVRYDAEYSLYEVTYGNGADVLSAERFRELQYAWCLGDVETANVPPVQITAISDWHAVTGQVKRQIWPKGDPMADFNWDDDEEESDDFGDEEDAPRKPSAARFFQGEFVEVPGTRRIVTKMVGDAVIEDTIAVDLHNNAINATLMLRFANPG